MSILVMKESEELGSIAGLLHWRVLFYHENTKVRNTEKAEKNEAVSSWVLRLFRCLFFVFSSFRNFVIVLVMKPESRICLPISAVLVIIAVD